MVGIIVQARCSSTRLPNKVLADICGKTLIEHVLERAARSTKATDIILATSTDPRDDALEQLCLKRGIKVFRGSLDDVLDRFYQAAKRLKVPHLVRITGDCPLIDPQIVDAAIGKYSEFGYDYLSNALAPSYPDGLDVEVVSMAALETAWKNASLPSEREHVTPYIYRHPESFKIGTLQAPADKSFMRWTVDNPRDLDFVRTIYNELYFRKPNFVSSDIYALTEEKPGFDLVNAGTTRNEGYMKSLSADHAAKMTKLNLTKSLDMQNRGSKVIPGMTQLLSKRPDQFSRGAWPGYFSRAKGVQVWDLDGNEYTDMSIGGIGANILGYCDQDVDQAVLKAIQSGVSSSLNCPEEVELAEKLCEMHPWAEMVRFTRSGGEALAVAVRIARAATGKDLVAFCGYHGWHDWYLAANLGTEDALGNHLLPGLDPAGVPRGLAGTALTFRYNNIAELQKIISKEGARLAAIVMEPVRGETPDPAFFKAIQQAVKDTGAVWIMDEVSAGFRLTTGGAHLTLGLTPDMSVFSKALGNGYAIAAVIGRKAVMEHAQRTFISSTNWTERVGPAAALAMIAKHARQKTHEHLVEIGQSVQHGWQEIADSVGIKIHVGGIAPMGHFSFEHPKANVMKAFFVQEMLQKGFLASTSFYAMAPHSSEHVKGYLTAMAECFTRLKQGLDAETIEESLLGKPSVPGFKRLTS